MQNVNYKSKNIKVKEMKERRKYISDHTQSVIQVGHFGSHHLRSNWVIELGQLFQFQSVHLRYFGVRSDNLIGDRKGKRKNQDSYDFNGSGEMIGENPMSTN